ncbi:cellulase N-terminal Ig-like domain-containing protein [Lentisphaerota bacterium WC36G]|nr:hypothetical protein LJT99_11520 [Lentisphaerae bacterium WC36]
MIKLTTKVAFSCIMALGFANELLSKQKNNSQRKITIKKATSDAKIYNNSSKFSINNCFDNKISDNSRWIGVKENDKNLIVTFNLSQKEKIARVHLFSGYKTEAAISDFHFTFLNKNNQIVKIPSANFTNNKESALAIPFDTTLNVETKQLQLVIKKTPDNLARIKELVIWRENGKNIPSLKTKLNIKQSAQKIIFVNQSGYNINKAKLFTAPNIANGTTFEVINSESKKAVFTGKIFNQKGDFSAFNPQNSSADNAFQIKIGNNLSVPFAIANNWIERVTYQNSINFMIDSRHRFGTYKKYCGGSFGWRDDHHFGWELNTLVPQFLSNPEAYLRMPKTVKYEKLAKFNGALTPFSESAPDIVKLIHFGADIIVTQKLRHEFFKEQLAYFLYAYPHLKEWLPAQNYQIVKGYALKTWGNSAKDRNYPYDNSTDHNLFAIKPIIGTTKGNNPPGHSVLPNLLMYEVLKRDCQDKLAQNFFNAAYNQVEWMIKNIDWNNPQTTKGQRMSEHITMTGLVFMLQQYPNKAPKGLKKKINDWQNIVIERSKNLWDFRKLSTTKWVPDGKKRTMWNEVGNVVGLPAVIFATISLDSDKERIKRLNQIAYSHIDNMFGRNPTGRHFSYHAPEQVEGVEHGWYSFHKGGIGKLEEARFVLDGCPYPFHPEVGNIGWTEGWIQHNNPLNLSLAYMAYLDTKFNYKVNKVSGFTEINLQVPLNFDYRKIESVSVNILYKDGSSERLKLFEKGCDSAIFSVKVNNKKIAKITKISYGLGYFEKFISPKI